MTLETETMALYKADQDIEEGKARIERQRQLMQRLGMAGHDTEAALVVLKALEGALEAMHAHRAYIKGSIERLKHAA